LAPNQERHTAHVINCITQDYKLCNVKCKGKLTNITRNITRGGTIDAIGQKQNTSVNKSDRIQQNYLIPESTLSMLVDSIFAFKTLLKEVMEEGATDEILK